MFVPPDQRPSWQPPPPARPANSGEKVLLVLIAILLLSMLLGPIAGGTLLQALPALWPH